MSNRCELTGIGVMSGNNVPNSMKKTKRKFLPNLQKITLRSDALKTNITLRLASATLRTINKYGNLDLFLINYKVAKLTNEAKKLRNKVKIALAKSGNLEDIKVVRRKKEIRKETKLKKDKKLKSSEKK